VRRFPVPNYRQLHEDSLAQNRPDLHRELKKSGKLKAHLDAVSQDAESLFQRVLADLKQSQPYNPLDWQNDQAAWEGALERSAREFVLSDRVLVPDRETERAQTQGY
jgi:hypothetical protein